MPAHILHEDDGAFVRIALNRPRAGNLVSPAMLARLPDLVGRVGERHKAVLIEARGPDFCVGRDPGAGRRPATAHEAHARIMGPILAVYAAFRRCPVPVIAAARGRAFGFGSGILGAADISLADEDARFSLPEMAAGIPPTLVMSALADVNRKAVADLVYSGRIIGAAEAHAIGLVSRVVPCGGLDAAVNELHDVLAGYDAGAVTTVKRFLCKPGHLDAESLSDLAGYTLATAFTRPR